MPGVVPERNGRSIRGAYAAMRREHEKFFAAERGGIPTHARVLRPPEQIARRALPQHLRGERQRAGRAWRTRGHVKESWVVGVERIRGHLVEFYRFRCGPKAWRSIAFAKTL
jgi:hypothetical protein